MSFYYIQRLESSESYKPNPFGSHPSVSSVLLRSGAKVELSYMGSSEFEGTKTIRSGNALAKVARNLSIVTQTLVRPAYVEDVHFVCTPEQQNELLPRWHEWAQNPRTIERTGYFRDVEFDASGRSAEDTVAWWALDEDLIWAREQAVAENILGAFVKLGNLTRN